MKVVINIGVKKLEIGIRVAQKYKKETNRKNNSSKGPLSVVTERKQITLKISAPQRKKYQNKKPTVSAKVMKKDSVKAMIALGLSARDIVRDTQKSGYQNLNCRLWFYIAVDKLKKSPCNMSFALSILLWEIKKTSPQF